MPLVHASCPRFSLGMPHDLGGYRWQRRVLWKGRSIAITLTQYKLDPKVSNALKHIIALH
jgi:hypothetical protein